MPDAPYIARGLWMWMWIGVWLGRRAWCLGCLLVADGSEWQDKAGMMAIAQCNVHVHVRVQYLASSNSKFKIQNSNTKQQQDAAGCNKDNFSWQAQCMYQHAACDFSKVASTAEYHIQRHTYALKRQRHGQYVHDGTCNFSICKSGMQQPIRNQ